MHGFALALLAFGSVAGPLPESNPSLVLRIHLGDNRESRIVRAELQREELYFLEKLASVRIYYRIELVESLKRSRPMWQIGKSGELQAFPPGTFNATGTFTRTLVSIAEQDQFERWEPDNIRNYMFPEFVFETRVRPKVYPPRVE